MSAKSARQLLPSAGFRQVSASTPALLAELTTALAPRAFDASIAIGLIGCGWIAEKQLEAYRRAGMTVVALHDRHPERAAALRDKYFPKATTYGTVQQLLSDPNIRVVDVTTHVDERGALLRQCISAKKHVLSQKPFVEDIDEGLELARLAQDAGVTLAVNQNGRWAPHFGAMLAVVAAGLIGTPVSADFSIAWPHDEVVAEKPTFATMADLVLFDFGSHWFDILGLLTPGTDSDVFAVSAARRGQSIAAPTQASVILTSAEFMGTLNFRASERFDESGRFRVTGTRGVITQSGTSLGGDMVFVHSTEGSATVATNRDWFTFGLAGAMRALLHALTTGGTPTNDGGSSLRGLELCFAALESARTHRPVRSGAARTRLPQLEQEVAVP